jgi:hypothetical protein
MTVKRRQLVRYLEQNAAFACFAKEANIPSTRTNDEKTIPVKRHRTIDRITANELCKQAGLKPTF